LKAKLDWMVPRKNVLLERIYNLPPLDADEILNEYYEIGQKVKKYVCDTAALIFTAVRERKNILFEGAQGTLLDLDHGTYPYVTSSSPTAGGACTGTGVGPTSVDRVIGVMKAYVTRVGEGPFPTELTDALGERLREVGVEVGTTTGRPRRCGWFDAVLGRYAVRINGLDCLAVTKLDVLDGFEEIQICTAYRDRQTGETHTEMPSIGSKFQHMEPVFKTVKGWLKPTTECRTFKDLPEQAKAYLNFIAEELDIPIAIVSVGPTRDNTVVIEDPIHGPKRVLSKPTAAG
jgi:adenylosuccinate synthase